MVHLNSEQYSLNDISVGNNQDEDDEMAGAIDLNDVDWASSDIEGVVNDGGIDEANAVASAAAALMDTMGSPPVSLTAPKITVKEPKQPNSAADQFTSGNGQVPLAAVETAVPRSVGTPSGGVPPSTSARATRGSRAQRTTPFNLKACSACKKGKATALMCRLDRRHWEDPDWADPPSRPWNMPSSFVEWLRSEEQRQAAQAARGEDSSKGAGVLPGTAAAAAQFMAAKTAAAAEAVAASTSTLNPFAGSPTNKAAQARVAAAAAAAAASAAATARSMAAGPSGPREPSGESAAALLSRMLGSAALPPAPAPRPPPAPVVLASNVAPGAPAMGSMGIKRPRCLAKGCMNAVTNDAAFCSVECTVTAQKQACQALIAYHKKQQPRLSRAASASAAATSPPVPGFEDTAAGNSPNNGSAAPAVSGAHGGGNASAVASGDKGGAENDAAMQQAGGGAGGGMGSSGGRGGGGQAVAPATSVWTAEDEAEFANGLETVRARGVLTPAMRFRQKVKDRFRELFAEGMSALGLEAAEILVTAGVLAWDLEHELNVFSQSDRGKYKEKAQALRFNIKFSKNPELFKVGVLFWGRNLLVLLVDAVSFLSGVFVLGVGSGDVLLSAL